MIRAEAGCGLALTRTCWDKIQLGYWRCRPIRGPANSPP
jgi:hypothetical protein